MLYLYRVTGNITRQTEEEEMVWEKERIREIYDRNFDGLYRICLFYMKNKEEALDLVQESFVKLMQKRENDFSDQQHIDMWLRVVACNLCKNELHHWWKKKRIQTEDWKSLVKEQSEDDASWKAVYLEAIMSLPEKYRILIYFHYYEDYTIEELGKLLKENPSTLRSRLSKGKKLLGEKLKEAGVYEE